MERGEHMELYATDMFFRGENEKERAYDCCIHGKVIFRIGDTLLSDHTEWCVSASAYRFLHTLFKNHFMGAEEFLIPCCGHTMIPSEDKASVSIIGCSNGIDFNILHSEDHIAVVTKDNAEYHVSFAEYKNAVIAFAKQVMDFYKANPPREFEDDFDREGYDAFVTEWHSLYAKAFSLSDDIPAITPIAFEDYDACTEKEILGIRKDGISLRSFGFINFRECAYNFRQTQGGSGKCVGERAIADLSFTFYTSPKPIMIKFIGRNRFLAFISKQNAISRFHKLQKQLLEYGYSTRDMS